jgi:excisionase family DNA binding protein
MQAAKSNPVIQPIEFPDPTQVEVSHRTGPTSRMGPDEHLLTPQQVADRLGVSQRWVRDHATRRWPRMTAVKLGSLLRFRWTDVEDFLAHQTLQPSSKKRAGGV